MKSYLVGPQSMGCQLLAGGGVSKKGAGGRWTTSLYLKQLPVHTVQKSSSISSPDKDQFLVTIA